MHELFGAIKAGDASAVAALLDSDPSLVNATHDNVTPILWALYVGKRELAGLFVERGANVSLPEAAALGDLERVRSLLDANPSLLDERSADGYPPLGLAIFFGQPDVARFLIERGTDVNAHAANAQRVAPLHAAAAICDRELVRLLLERGADPNAKQQLDYTPLHTAAARNDREIATLLLGRGADREAKGSDGLTPAGVAEKYGHPEFAQWLSGA